MRNAVKYSIEVHAVIPANTGQEDAHDSIQPDMAPSIIEVVTDTTSGGRIFPLSFVFPKVKFP